MITELPVRQRTYAPVEHLMLYVTEECNLRCTYCFVKKSPRWMTPGTARKTLDFFLSGEVSGASRDIHLTFFCGEPFLAAPIMQQIVDDWHSRQSTTRKELRFHATTNGTLATPAVEKVIKDGQIRLLLSIDGRPQTHDERPRINGKNSYPQLLRALPRLLEWSPSVTARITFHPRSLDLVGNVRHAFELGISSICLCPVLEVNWRGHEAALQQSYQELGDWFLAEFRAGRHPPLVVTWNLLQDYAARRGQPFRPCKACALGTSLLAVDPDGRVLPCHRFLYHKEHHLGSVNLTQLPDRRWDYVDLPRAEVPDCESCVARSVCGGGCRLVALEGGYGLGGVHPNHCLLLQTHMRQVERIYEQLHADARFRARLGQSTESYALRELLN